MYSYVSVIFEVSAMNVLYSHAGRYRYMLYICVCVVAWGICVVFFKGRWSGVTCMIYACDVRDACDV